MKRLDYKHPRAIRWMHWINFPLLMIMIWSGSLIYWANDVYRIGIGSFTLVHFFPDWVYSAFHLDHSLAQGMAWHFAFMWLFAVNGAAYVIYTFVSGEWRYLLPNRNSLREAIQVTLYDFRHRDRDLEVGSIRMVDFSAGRLSGRPRRTFPADLGLCDVLRGSHRPGDSRRLE
jgi:thiosulfate reductase cytochrome b subunit